MIDALDDCLFKDNFAAGCICHKLEDARDIFRNKITFAYENIDDAWHALLKMLGTKIPTAISDKSGSGAYVFDNGSSIKVNAAYRRSPSRDQTGIHNDVLLSDAFSHR